MNKLRAGNARETIQQVVENDLDVTSEHVNVNTHTRMFRCHIQIVLHNLLNCLTRIPSS